MILVASRRARRTITATPVSPHLKRPNLLYWPLILDGSYYYSNGNNSTYYNNGNGSSTYTAPNGNAYKK
jgi:hypothetical protein